MFPAQYTQKKKKKEKEDAIPPNVIKESSPCKADSYYHDLKCGHRIKTAYPDYCGGNCKLTQMPGNTEFICNVCVTDEVRVMIQLQTLDLASNDDTSNVPGNTTREEQILHIAKKEIAKLTNKNHRICWGVEKLDPVLQFYSSIAGPQEENLLATPQPTPGRKRPRSKATVKLHRRSRSPEKETHDSDSFRQRDYRGNCTTKDFTEDLTDHLGGTSVGMKKEDDITEVVGELLEGLALEDAKLKDGRRENSRQDAK